jgi:uncharacterized membrane protein
MIGSVVAGTIRAGFRFGPTAFMVGSSLTGYKERVQNGQNPAFAAAMEGTQFAASMMLPLPAQMALFGVPVTRAVAAGVINSVRAHNSFVRMAKTPFSHRFEHSEVTSRMQQAGLQSIGAAWGHASMGSEASQFARRYAR